jgi:O-antigen/teichoic acid export membrane protein
MKHAIEEVRPQRLLGRASLVAAGAAYRQGISFISGLVVARVIGAADYGIFNLARNLVDVMAIFTRLGLDLGLQRYFGETNTAEDQASRVAVLRRVRLLAGAAALLPVAAVALGVGRVLEANVYQYSGFAEVLLCLALALPFLTDISVLGGAYRGIIKLAPSVMAECILLPTIRLAAIVVLFLIGWRLWAVVVGTTVGSFFAAAFLAMRARSDFDRGAPGRTHPWADSFRVVGYSSVLAGSMIVTTLTTSMDTLQLGHFTTAQDLGQYTLVKTLLILTGVFGVACGQGLESLVADRYFRGDLDGMVHVMSVTARVIALVTVPIFAIFLFWGAHIALLFGPSFVVSQSVVAWLATSQLVFLVFWPSATGLSMTGRHVLELKILLGGLAIATLSCWFAVPAYGQIGAAVSTCASVGIANLARVLVVRRYVGRFPFGGDIFLIAAAGVAFAWCSYEAMTQLSLPSFWNVVCGIACFVLIYGIAAWTCLLNESEKSDIREVIRIPGRMLFNDRGKTPA